MWRLYINRRSPSGDQNDGGNISEFKRVATTKTFEFIKEQKDKARAHIFPILASEDGADFELAKAQLCVEEMDGVNLYEHLTNAVMKLVKEKPEGPLNNLEDKMRIEFDSFRKQQARYLSEHSRLIPLNSYPTKT